jgi:hypothetical protein
LRHAKDIAFCAAIQLALASSVFLAPLALVAGSLEAPDPLERSQALLSAGDAALERGDSDAAIHEYERSYDELPEAHKASYLGSLTIRNTMQAYDRRISEEHDASVRRELLLRQRTLLDAYIVAVKTREGAVDEIGVDIMAELEESLRRIDDAISTLERARSDGALPSESRVTGAPAEAVPDEPAIDAPLGPVSPATTSVEPPRARDWLGTSVVVAGSALFGAGVGVSIGYFTIRSTALALADAGGEDYAPGTDARAQYLAQEYDRAHRFLVAGSVVASIGLAAVVGGIVRLVVHRRRSSSRVPAGRRGGS